MKTRLDEWNEGKGIQAKPHEREPYGESGCRTCVFSPGHPVHNHVAPVISLADRIRRRR